MFYEIIFLHFSRISENFILIEPLELYARIFDMDWMKERLLRGDCVELKYAFRFFGKRSTMTLWAHETTIGDIHDIARDPQWNHMIVNEMEHELVVEQLYDGVDIYEHDFKSELFDMLSCRKCFCELCINFAQVLRCNQILEG